MRTSLCIICRSKEHYPLLKKNYFGGGVAVILWFEHWSDQSKDYTIGVCCFADKRTELRSKIKFWPAHKYDKYVQG